MIYLAPEVASGLGEDTFWTWFKREIPDSKFYRGETTTNNDVVLRYSTANGHTNPKHTICLLWELYPEMKEMLKSNTWDFRMTTINSAIKSAEHHVLSSKIMIPYYEHMCSKLNVLPIGVNTNLFKPLNSKDALRKKYGIPLDKRVGVWGGTTHTMKGHDKFLKYKQDNPDIVWIILWKWKQEASEVAGCFNYIQVPQEQMNELFNCADFFLSTSRLRPFYMMEWEALASNLNFIILDNIQKDFTPSENPRDQVIELGWDRETAKKTWLSYIDSIIKKNNAQHVI